MSQTVNQVTRGHFTLDRAQAREKLSRYQLANPYAYVLELVQSAVLRGATKIEFSFDSDDMRMSFDGAPYSADDLSHLEMAVLETADSDEARSRRQLAAGLLAAEALKPQLMVVDSAAGSRLEIRAGQPERLIPSDKTTPGTMIHLRERWHPKLLLKFWRNLRGKGTEQALLRHHCAAARISILVNGQVVSGKPHGSTDEAMRLGEVVIENGGSSGWGGFIAGQTSELEVYCHGVKIETVPLDLGPLPFRAVISAPHLEKDLSGAALQRNADFDLMMVLVRESRARAIEKLCLEETTLFPDEARRELLSLKDIKKLQDPTTFPGCLAKLRVWKLANGEWASFAELAQAREKHGFLPYSSEYQAGLTLDGLPVVWLSEKDLHADMKNLIFVRNVTRRLRNLKESQANREKWRSTPTEAKLCGRGYLAYQDIDTDGIRGQLGIRKSATPGTLRLLKDGCLLSQIFPPGWPLGVELVLEADFAPTANFDGVQPDQTLENALVHGLQPLPKLSEEVAKPSSVPFFWRKPQATLDILADYLRVFTQPSPLGYLLVACNLSPQGPAFQAAKSEWSKLRPNQESALFDVRWLKTQNGERRSLREITRDVKAQPVLALGAKEQTTLARLLGDEILQQITLSDSQTPGETAPSKVEFVPDEGWLEEEYFLAALRAELRALTARDDDILVADIRASRILFSDQPALAAVEMDSSGLVLLRREHPLIIECLSHYREQPSVLLILVSLLLSALNRHLTHVNDADESRLQEALLELALSSHARHLSQAALRSGEAVGYLEPFCDSGYGTGWANDPAGLGLRFYIEEPTLSSEPLIILDLNSPRPSGGHDFLFELPRQLLDGRRLKIWACLLDPAEQKLRVLAGSPRTFAPVLKQPMPPVGWFEEVTQDGLATGWCLDPNQPQANLRVEFYMDGNHVEGEYIGACEANIAKPEVLELTGYQGDHGFRFQVPEQHIDGSSHRLWAYTFDVEGVSINPLLNGSPITYGTRSAAPTVLSKDLETAQRVDQETANSASFMNQCEGRTASGTRCKRPSQNNSRFCHQHFG